MGSGGLIAVPFFLRENGHETMALANTHRRDALAAGAEEVGEQGAALFGEEVGGDFDFVVELGVVHDGEDRTAGSGFGIGGGVDEAREARVEDGSGAHGTGFEGGVEGAVFEAVVSEDAAGFAKGDDLGVGGGIAVAEDPVLASTDNFVFVDDDCAYRDFAIGFGVVCFGDGSAQIGEVSGHSLIGKHGLGEFGVESRM
jgi:hypothetical protein